jgi:hypothetical protein
MSEIAAGSRLEQRYRAVLRVLPAAYRAAWEEDMVATFLATVPADDPEDAEFAAEYGRPGWGEVASVLLLAVRLRIPGLRARVGGPGAAPSGIVWGEAIRLVALTGILVNAITALAAVVSRLWLLRRIPLLPGPPADIVLMPQVRLRYELWLPMGVCWTAAFAALLLGSWRAAQTVAALALVLEVARVLVVIDDLLAGAKPYLLITFSTLVLNAAVVLGLLAFHRKVPPPRPGPWLAALVVGAPATFAVDLLNFNDRVPLVDWYSISSIALVVAAGVHLGSRRRPRAPGRTLALALIAAVVFYLRCVDIVDYVIPAGDAVPLALDVAEAIAVLAVGLVLARLAARDVRACAPALRRM